MKAIRKQKSRELQSHPVTCPERARPQDQEGPTNLRAPEGSQTRQPGQRHGLGLRPQETLERCAAGKSHRCRSWERKKSQQKENQVLG